jgi:hypothetical protein
MYIYYPNLIQILKKTIFVFGDWEKSKVKNILLSRWKMSKEAKYLNNSITNYTQ